MANIIGIQQMGDQLAIAYDDGARLLAYPTVTGWWQITTGSGPGPGGGLVDWFTPEFGISGDWEDHWTYSRGGTDWPMSVGTGLKAVAPGTVVNYPNVDGAGLKTMLVFDTPYPRVLPASSTLMNGVYRETDAGDAPAVAFMMQHLSSQVAEGHYNAGDIVAISGNTGDTTGPHLHAHLLASPSVGGNRLDFMKFLS